MRAQSKQVWAFLFAMTSMAVLLPGLSAQSPPLRDVPAGVRLASFEQPAQPAPPAPPAPAPKVSFVLKDRHGHATPVRTQVARSGGGNTDVAQPREDTVVITMSAVVTAPPHPGEATAASMAFDLDQEFEIAFADPKLKKAKFTIEAQVMGLLRGDRNGGSACVNGAGAVLFCGQASILALAMDGHEVSGGDNLSINDRKGPMSMAVPAGDYHLMQTFRIGATHARGICGKAAAAEFAPDPALDPTWISATDPFRGTNKKEFGFRVTLRIEPE
jgi:hypothetical protein